MSLTLQTSFIKNVQFTSFEPELYGVILHNDDFTPAVFVELVLRKFFKLETKSATKIIRKAHTKGRVVFGLYTREEAETKIIAAVEYARMNDHPLLFSLEVG